LRLTGKRRRKHGPGVEEAGDWVGELRGAAPELGDGLAGGSEGPGWRCMVVPEWQHGGVVGAEEGGRRKGPSRGRAPFIAGRGGGRRAARRQNRGGEMVAGSRGRGSRWRLLPGVVGAVQTRSVRGSDRAADGWAQRF
jgi:hypothetical protein